MINFTITVWSLFTNSLNKLTDRVEAGFNLANEEYAGAGRANHPTTYDRYAMYHNPPKEEDEVA